MYRDLFRMDIDPRFFDNLQSRIFKIFEDEFGMRRPRRFSAAYPAVNFHELPTEFVMETELPGLAKEDIDLQISGNKITFAGEFKETKVEGASFHRRERECGSFSRTFTLPTEIDPGKAKAEFKDGVLRVRIAKAEKALPKKIAIEG